MSGKIVDDTRLARFWSKAKAYVDGLFSDRVKTNVPANAVFTDTTYSAGTNVQISSSKVISATDTTYNAATTSAAGLMSAADKVAVNKIGTGTLNTSNKNCIAAINELKSSLGYGGLISYSVPTYNADGASGYIRLPGKIQICFGTATKNNNGATVTFANAFSDTPFVSFSHCSTYNSSSASLDVSIYRLTSTGFSVMPSMRNSSDALHYIAIGKYS